MSNTKRRLAINEREEPQLAVVAHNEALAEITKAATEDRDFLSRQRERDLYNIKYFAAGSPVGLNNCSPRVLDEIIEVRSLIATRYNVLRDNWGRVFHRLGAAHKAITRIRKNKHFEQLLASY